MIYPGSAMGNIGALLRAIQEERQNMPHIVPPNMEVGAPTREAVTGPLTNVESPDSSKVVSVRPELQGGSQDTMPNVVAPMAPTPAMPVATPVPTPIPPMSAPSPMPSSPVNPAQYVAQSRTVNLPSLGTKLTPSVLGNSSAFVGPRLPNASMMTPTRSTFGGPIVSPEITPVPKQGYLPGTSTSSSKSAQDYVRKLQQLRGSFA